MPANSQNAIVIGIFAVFLAVVVYSSFFTHAAVQNADNTAKSLMQQVPSVTPTPSFYQPPPPRQQFIPNIRRERREFEGGDD